MFIVILFLFFILLYSLFIWLLYISRNISLHSFFFSFFLFKTSLFLSSPFIYLFIYSLSAILAQFRFLQSKKPIHFYFFQMNCGKIKPRLPLFSNLRRLSLLIFAAGWLLLPDWLEKAANQASLIFCAWFRQNCSCSEPLEQKKKKKKRKERKNQIEKRRQLHCMIEMAIIIVVLY